MSGLVEFRAVAKSDRVIGIDPQQISAVSVQRGREGTCWVLLDDGQGVYLNEPYQIVQPHIAGPVLDVGAGDKTIYLVCDKIKGVACFQGPPSPLEKICVTMGIEGTEPLIINMSMASFFNRLTSAQETSRRDILGHHVPRA